jgi:hypothetical protein
LPGGFVVDAPRLISDEQAAEGWRYCFTWR